MAEFLKEFGTLKDLGIDDVFWHFPAMDGQCALAVDASHVAEQLFGPRDGVRGQDDIFHGGQRRILAEWLLLEYVERGAGDLTALKCLNQRGLVDDGAARGIDEDGIGFHTERIVLSPSGRGSPV